MENLSHSLRHSKHSRRSSHANAAAKGVHDDVFGGPPKFGVPATLSPRAEDYREIFGRFHAPRVSSIPVLDLPVVDEHDAYFDFRSPGFDYSEVFGGFRGLDFADGYEELFGQRRCGSTGSGSSDEAWTPTASESLSEESDHSGNNQCLSNGDSHHSLDGSIKHNISYHKANTRSDIEITNGLRRTAEIHAVPGYSYMVDHIDPYQVKEKQLKKTRSDNLNVRNDVRRQRDYGRVNSCPRETFMTISEVNLRTKPSHLPPPSRPPPAAAIGDTNGSVSSCKTGYLEGNSDNSSTSSQPFFDVEVDASSSAAAVASAAAMKEAMVKAQAQLRSAKEMMERKKEGRKNHARMGSSGEWRDMGGNCLNEDMVNGRSRGKGSQMKNLIMEEPRDVMGMKCVVQDPLEGEKLQNCLKQSPDKVQGEESEYSEKFGKLEEADQWKEAAQFFELGVDRSGAVLSQRDKEKYLPESLRTCDSGEMEGTLGGFPGQENFNMIKATVERRVPHEDSVVDAKNVNPKGAKEVSTEKDIEKKEKASQYIGKCEEAKKTHSKAHHDRETLVNLNGCASSEDHESPNVLIEVVHEFEVEQVMEHKRDGLKLKKSSRRPGAKENVTEGHEKACNEKRPREPSGREEKEGKPSIVIELMGNEKRHRELYMQEEEENKQTVNLESAWEEAEEREENEWRLKETHELEENEKRMREDLEQEERKKLKEAHEQDENDKRMKANVDLAENKRKQEAAARDEKRLREANKQAEKVKLKEALEEEENEKKLVGPLEQEEKEQRKKEALGKEEMEKMLKESFEREESEKRLNEAREKEQTKKRLEEAHEMEENERRLRETHTRECCQDEYDDNNLKDSHMDERISTRDERDDDMEEDDAAKDTFELEELDKWLQEVVDVEEPDYLNDADKKVEVCMQHDTENAPDFPASGFEQVGESRDAIDTSNDDGDQILAEDSIKSPPLFDRPEQMNRETPKVFSQMSNESRQQDEKNSAQEWGETKENINKTEACFDEDGKRVETPQPAVLNTQRISRQLQNASQAEGRKENLNGSVEVQERESERLRREQEVEKDRLRKIEEEKEREREREKDRMGIDRVTLEAKERAYAEVREKAERASVERAIAEARQRSLAEARERLEKACAEAREQSVLEKMSMEARIKAERAAMERATAEARERAASKYNGMRQSNLTFDLRESQHQTSGSSSSTKHQNSSEYGTPYNVQKSEGVEGESAQRCKARLERHRRTAERAAKALAEKNMRDLLAQREQAERSRLAETLDADVKRWSSGKEGNLRALLSTLQYILGPDSGWQPVPLTEVITSAAVKKAYRKATLCVHPDKLQQRGASIQQKYICEKVFDLLKEAWNRFNSEER